MKSKVLWPTLLLLLLAAGPSCQDRDRDPLVELVLAPSTVTIDTTTDLRLRVTGLRRSGRVVENVAATWQTTAGDLEVDPPGAEATFADADPGSATITATYGDLQASSTIRTVLPGLLRASMVDSESGAALSGATMALVSDSSAAAVSGPTGEIELMGGFQGPIDVFARAPGYVPVAVYGARAKDLLIPMRRADPVAVGRFAGEVIFTEREEPPPGSLFIAFVAPALKHVLLLELDHLLSPLNETVDLSGLEIALPTNIFTFGLTPQYAMHGDAGTSTAYAIGGEMTLTELVELINGTEAYDPETNDYDARLIFANALRLFDRHHFGTFDPLTLELDSVTTNVDLSLDAPRRKRRAFSVPPRPVLDPRPVLLLAVDVDEDRALPVGIGVLDGADAVHGTVFAPSSNLPLLAGKPYRLVAVSAEGGFRDDVQLLAVTAGPVSDPADLELPEFLVPPALGTFSSSGLPAAYRFAQVPRADFSTHVLRKSIGPDQIQWDVYTSHDVTEFALPAWVGSSADMRGGEWRARAVGLRMETFDAILGGSGQSLATWPRDANRLVTTDLPLE